MATDGPIQVVQAPDTTTVAADSIAVSLDRIGQGVTDLGQMILQGRWSDLTQLAAEGSAGMVALFVPRLISALFVGLFFYILYRFLFRMLRGLLQRTDRVDRGLASLGMKTLRVMALGFIGLMVLSQLGVNLSALLAGLGIAGLAIGFAAKDSLENFIAGITILLDRPFVLGDWITVGENFGKVTGITLRSTRLRTLNRETIIFPSVDMVTRPIVNHSAGSPLRVDVPFGIAYKEDVEEARRLVLEVAAASDDRLDSEEPRVVTVGLGDSSVDMELHLFVRDPAHAVAVRSDYTERIKKTLDASDVEIPFPHLQLFIDGAEGLQAIRGEAQTG